MPGIGYNIISGAPRKDKRVYDMLKNRGWKPNIQARRDKRIQSMNGNNADHDIIEIF